MKVPFPIESVPPLGHIPFVWTLTQGDFTQEEITRAAVFTGLSRNASKAEKMNAIGTRFNDPDRMRPIIRQQIKGPDLTVLRLFRRYGGYVDFTTMQLELVARGLIPVAQIKQDGYSYRTPAPLAPLHDKLALRSFPPTTNGYRYHAPVGYTCHTAFWFHSGVEPLPSLRATVNIDGKAPTTATTARAPVEFLMELSAFESELARMNRWTRTRTKLLPPPVIKKLTKALPSLTDRFHLFTDIFGFAGMIESQGHLTASFDPTSEGSPTNCDPLLGLHRAVHGWLLGYYGCEVNPKVGQSNPYGFRESAPINKVRSLALWGLQAAANTTDGWINSRLWLEWLHSILGESTPDVYVLPPDWTPIFSGYSTSKSNGRLDRNHWMLHAGRTILGALHHVFAPMGLVECGPIDAVDPVFRFTPYGRAFFARPDQPFPKSESVADDKPIVVQSNFEIVAPLALMSTADALMLAKFAKLTSAPGSPVQTFAMSDETIFRGLDAGLTIAGIQTFLTKRGKTPVPANVDRMLATWATNRERLVFSERVTVTIQPDGQYAVVPVSTKNALPAMGSKLVEWTIQPDLRITPTQSCTELSKVILRRITESSDGAPYRLTKASIATAIARGLTGPQIETWLMTYAGPTYREYGSLTLKNWLNPGSSTLAPLLLFSPPKWADPYLAQDREFQAFVIECTRDGYLIDASNREAFEALIAQRGFETTEKAPKKSTAAGRMIMPQSSQVVYDDFSDDDFIDDEEPDLPGIGQTLDIKQLSAIFGQLATGKLGRR